MSQSCTDQKVRFLPRGNRGFTLTELLVSIAVMAILGALLIPIIGGLRTHAEKTSCVSNLRQVAAAYLMYFQDNDMKLPHLYDNNDADRSSGLYSPNDINQGQSIYLGAPRPDLHAPVEISPYHMDSPVIQGLVAQDSPGYYNTTSYWPNATIWAQTKTVNNLINSRDVTQLSPSKTVMLGVASLFQLERTDGKRVYFYGWGANVEPPFIEFYDGDSTNMAYFDGHVESVLMEDVPDACMGAR